MDIDLDEKERLALAAARHAGSGCQCRNCGQVGEVALALIAELRAARDALVLYAYREWSEETYAAGFMSPTPETTASFVRWLEAEKDGLREDYETELLRQYATLASTEAVS